MEKPIFSVIIPARNEEKYIALCIRSVKASALKANMSIEIIVVLNRCTDNTELIAKNEKCIICFEDDKNLSKIRNVGAKIAQGEFLVTIDADNRMSVNMLQNIYKSLQSKKYIGGGTLIIPDRWSLGIIATVLCVFPIAYLCGFSSGALFCSQKNFFAIGGFDENVLVLEDIDFLRRLARYGKKKKQRLITLYRSYVLYSCRKFDQFGDWHFFRYFKEYLSILPPHKNTKVANKFWYDVKR